MVCANRSDRKLWYFEMTPRSLREKRKERELECTLSYKGSGFMDGYDQACADYAKLVAPLLEALQWYSKGDVFNMSDAEVYPNLEGDDYYDRFGLKAREALAAYKEQVGGEE